MIKRKRRSYFLSIISTIIIGLVTSFIYDYIKEKPILSTILIIVKNTYSWIVNIFNIQLKLWLILLLIISYYVIKLITNNYQKEPNRPIFTNYKEEKFENWLWKWDWIWSADEWALVNLRPFCPKCDIEIIDKSDFMRSEAVCPRCKKKYSNFNYEMDDEQLVRSVILDNVKKNNYNV